MIKKKLESLKNPESLDRQFNDLFRTGEYGKKSIMKNPYNILWILENCTEFKDLNWQSYLPEIKKSMNEKLAFSFPEHEILLNKLLINDDVIIQRMEPLIKSGIDINERGSMIIKKNSLPILKYSISQGLGINTVSKEGSSLLRLALVSNAKKIQDWLWSQEKLDKDFIDEEKCNYAILGLKYKNFKIINHYLENKIEDFFIVFDIKGNPMESHITIFHDIKEDPNISSKNLTLYNEVVKKLLTYTIENKPEYLYIKNNKGISSMENSYISKLVKKIMQDNLEKTLDDNKLFFSNARKI